MTAKSAPQLQQPRQSRTANTHLAAVLFILAGALIVWEAAAPVPEPAVAPVPAAQTARAAQPAAAVDGEEAPASAEAENRVIFENSRHRALSEFLSKRYRVSQAVTHDLVTIAHAAGQQMGLDPLLIIAVMAIESRFNPIAESVAGAKGLMQVIPKYHLEKFREFGGEKYAVFDPETNILVGARILKEYLARTGTLNGALQMYVGSSSEEEDPYIGKVMSEKERLQQVLRRPSPPRPRPDVEASLSGERFAMADTES